MPGVGYDRFVKLSFRWLVVIALILFGLSAAIYGIYYIAQNMRTDQEDSFPTLAFGMAFVFAGGALMARAAKLYPTLKEATDRRLRIYRAIQAQDPYDPANRPGDRT